MDYIFQRNWLIQLHRSIAEPWHQWHRDTTQDVRGPKITINAKKMYPMNENSSKMLRCMERDKGVLN